MKAIVYDGIQKVECRNVADPGIEKEDDVVVKVTSTAICGSDLHLVHGLVKGMYDGYILGHETMGIVEEAGKGVKNLKKGDRVVIPFPVACGHSAAAENTASVTTPTTTARRAACLATANTTGTTQAGRPSTSGCPTPTSGRKKCPRASPTSRCSL